MVKGGRFDIDGTVARSRLKEIWDKAAQIDFRDMGLKREAVKDQAVWKDAVK